MIYKNINYKKIGKYAIYVFFVTKIIAISYWGCNKLEKMAEDYKTQKIRRLK